MQAGGNRARFFTHGSKIPDASSNSGSPREGNFLPSGNTDSESLSSEFDNESNTTSHSTLVSFSKRKPSNDVSAPHRPVSDSSEGDTIAQRTRISEAEKAKREGHGKLNVSGLIKNVGVNAVKAPPPSASIKEVVENEEPGTRSPRPYPSKLISKSNAPSYPSAFPHFTSPSPPPPPQKSSSNMPPSNQLAFQAFKVPPHHTPRFDIAPEDALGIKPTSNTSHTDSNNSHISSRFPTNSYDGSIKGVTTAFNRKHSVGPRNSPSRFPSPVSHHSNGGRRSSRARSPHVPFEDDLHTNTSGPRGPRIESRNFSSEICDDSDFQETVYQGSERYHGSAQEQHEHQEQHGKRGKKRISDSGVDDVCVSAPLSKRARIEAYDELPFNRGSTSSRTNSPEVDSRDNPPFKKAISHDRRDVTRQDPHLKLFSGQDLDEYVATHMDRYEAAKKRWTECSSEEWEKGADELVDKFTKILDFVKEHMKRKVALYASLHARIDQHEKERGKTAELLKNAKRTLVAKTGIVVDEGKL